MKNKILLLVGLMLLVSSSSIFGKDNEGLNKNNPSPAGTIIVSSSPDLYDLTTKWATEYCRLNPGIQINVIKITDANSLKVTNNESRLSFISNKYYSTLKNDQNWKIVVGRDVVVPIINSNNPFFKEISEKGISQKQLARFLQNPENQNWGTLLKNDQNTAVNFYMVNDESVRTDLAQFTNINKNRIHVINVENSSELVSKIQNDQYSIGFCKINNIIDANGQVIVENIHLLPIDKNCNGRMDYIEKIYDDLNTFLRGVWIGKYTKALCSNIYTISPVKPTNEAEINFLKWVLADGQKYLTTYGYNDLVYSERLSELANLSDNQSYSEPTNNISSIPKLALIILISFVASLFVLDFLSKYLKSKKTKISDSISASSAIFNESSVKVPKGIFYDKSHTWAFMEKDGLVKIGIDDFIQHITGTLTQIKMKNPGDKIKKGEQLMSIIQKGKQLNIYAPISGTVVEQNKQLHTNSSKINSSPYSDGWVYMIEPTNWLRDIQFLFMSDVYIEWLKKEFARLKDFLAISVMSKKLEYAQVVLQDGGELKDCVLEDLGPEVWEDFQTKFIDSFK